MAELRAYLAQNNLPVEKLIQDVSTRWNSTLYMLERIHKLSNAVKSTAAVLDVNVPILTVEKWVIVKDMCIVLKPFEIVTREMSADEYVSASKVIVLKKGLLSSCKKMKDSGKFHCIASEVIESLESGLEKYYGDIEKNKTFTMCTFLDPRFKKDRMFDNPHDAQSIKEHVIEMVAHEILKSGHEEKVDESRSSAETETAAEDELGEFSPWAIYNEDFASCQEANNSTPSSRALVEVNRYLEDPLVGRYDDPLKWWLGKKTQYPSLYTLAVRMLCVVATSVPSERVFSKAGQILTNRRNRLSANKVQK